MKGIYSAMAALAASLAFAACSGIEIENPAAADIDPDLELIENGTMEVTFNCTMEDAEDPVATRTEFHDNTIWWSAGDVIRFYQRYIKTAGASFTTGYLDRTLTDAQESYSTTISFTSPAEFPAYYWAIYPSANIVSSRTTVTGQDGLFAKVTVPSEQNPTLDSFDPKADVLVSEYIEATEQQKTFNLRFRRVVALGKMTIKNLPSANNISSIEISCSPHYMAGDGLFGLDNTNCPGVSSGTGSTSLTLIYTESVTANSSDGMTAFFTCLPFTLAAEESFSVKVTTSAGEVFTKNITVPAGREIKFEEGKGTRFNVDMSTAEEGCTWFTLGQSSTANTINTIYNRVEKASTYSGSITSIYYVAVKASEYDPSVDYFASGYKIMEESSVTKINNGSALSASIASLEIDTEYKILYKVTNSDGKTAVLKRNARTDWFKLALVTRSAGGVQLQLTGVGLDPAKCRNYRVVATEDLPTSTEDYETYYTGTLSPGTSSSFIESINAKNGTDSYNLAITKYYTDKTNQAAMVSGTNYTAMMKVFNTRGESKFVYASADAK